jgi:Flp pilus assembly protein TadG
MNSQQPRSRSSSRRASALVETAIVLPVLLILTLGLIEYGWVFYKISQLNMAARHGVRVAVRPDATATIVENAVKDMMLKECGLQSDKFTLTYTPIAVTLGQPITVHISVNYSVLSLTGTGFLPLPDKLQGRGTMVKEGE